MSSVCEILTQVLSMRIRAELEVTISKSKGAFVKGKQTLDLALIGNGVVL